LELAGIGKKTISATIETLDRPAAAIVPNCPPVLRKNRSDKYLSKKSSPPRPRQVVLDVIEATKMHSCTEGSLKSTEGSLKGTKGSLKGTEGSLKGTEGSLKGTDVP
jgi:hypothetical protein